MSFLVYSPEERKVISCIENNLDKNLEIPEKLQQQLDYIANVIHDNGFTLYLSSFGCEYSLDEYSQGHYIDVGIKYKYNGAVQNISFDIKLNQADVDDTIIEVSFSKDSNGAIDILKKISEKYFVYLKPYTYINSYMGVKNPQALEELLKTYNSIADPQINYHILPRLKSLSILGYGTLDIDIDYKLLTEWINKGKLIRELVICLYIPGVAMGDNDDVVLNLINLCKSKKDALIAIECDHQVSSNIQDKLKELNEYTYNRKNLIIKLMTRLAKERISATEEFQQIVHKEFTQLLKDDTLEVFWNLRNDPKIHKMISEKLKSGTKCINDALTKFSTSIFNEYIFPDTNGIENCEVLLSPELNELTVHFKKLPLELREHIVKFTTSEIFSSSFNEEDQTTEDMMLAGMY